MREREGFTGEPGVLEFLARYRDKSRALCSEELAIASFFTRRASLSSCGRRAPRRTKSQEAATTIAFARAFSLSWPVERSAPVRSRYGPRVHPVLGVPKLHRGVDLGVPDGTEIWAAADGKVRRVREDAINGLWFEIDHGQGVRTTYCHVSHAAVKAGQRVSRGERVGLSGSSGRVTGPHLHYQVSIGGQPVDPLAYRGRRLSEEAWDSVLAREERGRALPCKTR